MTDFVRLARDTLAATDGGVYQGPQPRERIVLLAQHVLDLREENKRYREALEWCADAPSFTAPASLRQHARAALAEKESQA